MLTRKRLGANGDPAEIIATRKAGRPDGRLESDLAKQLNGPLTDTDSGCKLGEWHDDSGFPRT